MRFFIALPLLLVACSSEAPAPAPAAPRVCDGDAMPSAIDVGEGGRARLPRTGALARPDVAIEPVGDLEVEAAESLTVRAKYGAADAAIRVKCGAGPAADVPVRVRRMAWSKVASWSGAGGPPAREYFAMWLDESNPDRLLVFGGFHYEPRQFTPAWDLWEMNLADASWRALTPKNEPPHSPGGRTAPIPTARAVYYYGGSTPGTTPGAVDTRPLLKRFDYAPDRLEWIDASFEAQSPPSYTGSLMRDPKRNRWLAVCGVDTGSAGVHCNVDAYAPDAGWSRVAVAAGTKPRGRYGFHYAYDEETDRVIVFGGQVGQRNDDIAADTWALELGENPPRWVRLFETDPAATKRRNGAWVLDEIGHRLFVWGGTPDGANSVPGIQALSLDRGREAWTTHALPSEVPSRTSAMGVFDHKRARLVLGFGNGAAVYSDLWALAL